MSETKPQKRLVSKERYVYLRGKQTAWYFFATMLVIPGVLLLFTAFILLIRLFLNLNGWPSLLLGILFSGSISIALFQCVRALFVKAASTEDVAPITDHNAHLLPAQETLLRGSDIPPTVAQAELLRATQAAQETTGEELLRATIKGE